MHLNQEKHAAIQTLKSLKKRLSARSPVARIEFASLVFKADLYSEVVSHDLFDLGISGRDFDACFEQSDGPVVVHGIMKEALTNEAMRIAICATGAGVWDQWLATYQSQETQGDLLGFSQTA